MSQEKFTLACQDAIKNTKKDEVSTVIIRTKVRSIAEQETRMALDTLKQEQMATCRAELLSLVHRHYGTGPAFCKNLQDSQQESQEKVVNAAPKATGLWLANAVAVSGTRDEIQDLAEHEDIEQVDINPTFRIPEILQTPLENTPEVIDGNAWGIARIRASEVWGGYGRGQGILVGHLDTGVDDSHPALSGKVQFFEEFDAGGSPVGSPIHDSGIHGTHTAGTIVGRNLRGINIGVAPKAKLASALVLPGGGGTFAQIIGGMQWAIGQNVHVINMSLGAIGYNTLWNIPILNATLSGVLVVASIGNSGHGTSGGPGNDLFALGVGATQYRDVVAGFSSGETLINVTHTLLSPIYGPFTYMKPDISAPGAAVLSSIPKNDIAALNGTSMAAPHAAGSAALILSASPGLLGNPLGLRSILLGTIEDYGEAGRDQRFGFGRLDALAAAQTAVSMS